MNRAVTQQDLQTARYQRALLQDALLSRKRHLCTQDTVVLLHVWLLPKSGGQTGLHTIHEIILSGKTLVQQSLDRCPLVDPRRPTAFPEQGPMDPVQGLLLISQVVIAPLTLLNKSQNGRLSLPAGINLQLSLFRPISGYPQLSRKALRSANRVDQMRTSKPSYRKTGDRSGSRKALEPDPTGGWDQSPSEGAWERAGTHLTSSTDMKACDTQTPGWMKVTVTSATQGPG